MKLPGDLNLEGGDIILSGGQLVSARIENLSDLPTFTPGSDDGRVVLVTAGASSGLWVGNLNGDAAYGKLEGPGTATAGVSQIQISGNTSNSSAALTGSIVLAGGNNVTLSQAGQTITISAGPSGVRQFQISGNTLNDSSALTGSVYLAGGNNVTLSQVTGAGVGSVTISIPAAASGFTLKSFEPIPVLVSTASQSTQLANASSAPVFLYPVQIPVPVAAEYAAVVMSLSMAVAAQNFTQLGTLNWGLYTRETGGNNTRLLLAGSSSFTYGVTNSNDSAASVQFPTTTNAGGVYSTAEVQGTGSVISASYTGNKLVLLGLGSTLTPGHYWLGIHNRRLTTGFDSGAFLGLVGAASAGFSTLAPIGSASSDFSGSGSNQTLQIGGNWRFLAGSYSGAGNLTALPGTVSISQINQATLMMPFLKFETRV